MVEFISRTFRDTKVNPYKVALGLDSGTYLYEHEAFIRKIPMNYLPNGVVAFTDAQSNIAERPDEFLPYENGIPSKEAVRRHEFYHILIEEQDRNIVREE